MGHQTLYDVNSTHLLFQSGGDPVYVVEAGVAAVVGHAGVLTDPLSTSPGFAWY